MDLGIFFRRISLCACLLPLIAGLPQAAVAQAKVVSSPITLHQSVTIALEKNPQRKAAIADTKAAAADVDTARSSLYPHITFSEAGDLGDDPVYVFGSKLRQQRFATSDFALNILNTPPPFGNFRTRLGSTWTLFDSFASWHGVMRANRVKDAASQQVKRAEQEIIFHVIDTYYGVLLAEKQLDVTERSLATSRAILDLAKNRYESGVAVQSDYLNAQVRLATRKGEIIRAQDDLALAQAQFSTALGISTSNEFTPAETLTEKTFPDLALIDLENNAVEKRADLNQVRSQEAAQQQSVSMAKSAFGPRVNAYAGWEADNPTMFAGGGGNNWLAGFELQFDLFQGGAKRAELSHEQALAEKASAMKETAMDAVRLEVRRAYYDLDAARQQIDVARATITESQENLRINQDRYNSGLSTITDLLSAEETDRRTQTEYWQAIFDYQVGYANLALASGTLSSDSPVVKP